MKKMLLIFWLLSISFSGLTQNEESEFPKLIFEGTLIRVKPTHKAHQSYVFTMSLDTLIQGNYKENEISFECYAEFGGNELLKYFQCSYENSDSVYACYGSGRMVLYERDSHGTTILLFGSINSIETSKKPEGENPK